MRVGEARSLVADTSPRHKRSSAAAHHNKTLRAAEERMLKLEPMLARLLVPVLERAGEIAARNFVALATDHAMPLTAALEVQSNSMMVCVKPRLEEAEAIHDDDGYPPENLHVTLVYLGEIDGPLDRLGEALAAVAGRHAPLTGTVGGYGQFKTPGGPVGILLPDVPGLVELRVAVTLALVDAEIAYAREHGFEAHITVDPDAEPDELAKMLDVAGAPLSFDELLLVRGDTEVYRLPFTGRPPLTAAGRGEGEFCLPNELNKVTKPVRDKVVSTVGQAALEPLRLSFDVTSPAFQKVVGQAGKQITEISKTTQKDVMKAVKRSYDKGLSIPDAAAEIQTAMTDAALTRATMIARTELAGAVNGASLASMEVVNDELGGGEGGAAAYLKEWLTAPGAQNPRHETYEGLDGQSVHMDEPFDVGGEPVMYPGDPDGDPGETINCRCAMNYLDAQGNESDADIEASAQPLPCEAHDHLVELEGGSGPELAEKAGLAAGPPYVVAAAPPPTWAAPAPSELLNIDCAVSHAQAVMEEKKLNLTIYLGGEVQHAPMQTIYSQARKIAGLPDESFALNLWDKAYSDLYAKVKNGSFGAAESDALKITGRVTYDDVLQLQDESGKLIGLVDYRKPFTGAEEDTAKSGLLDVKVGDVGDEEKALEYGYGKLMTDRAPGTPVVIGRIATSGAYPGARVRVFQEITKVADSRKVGVEVRAPSQAEAKFYKKMGMTSQPGDPLLFRFTHDEAANFAKGIEPKPSPVAVSAPLPKAEVPTAETPKAVPGGGTYDVNDLPDYAKTPVGQLAKSDALAEAKKLKVLRHSLMFRAKNAKTEAKATALLKRAESASGRIEELEKWGKSGVLPEQPKPVMQVEHAAVPEATPEAVQAVAAPSYDYDLLPDYARSPVEALSPQQAAGERKKLVALRASLKQRMKNATGSRREFYQERIDATTARIDHLEAVAQGAKPLPGAGRATPLGSPTVNQYGALTAGNSVEEASYLAKVSEPLGRKFIDADSASATTAQTKERISKALLRRVEGNPDFERMVEHYKGKYPNGSVHGYGDTDAEKVVSNVIQTWAGSSNSTIELSQAVQRAVQEEFGLDAKSSLRKGTANDAFFKQRLDTLYGNIGPGLRVLMREMYNHTQEELRASQIKSVTLYRGMSGASKATREAMERGVPTPLSMQPASSFSNNVNVSRNFGGMGTSSAVYGTNVPAERILGTARTGFGCLHEEEWVVLGSTNGDTAYAVSHNQFTYKYSGAESFWKAVEAAAAL